MDAAVLEAVGADLAGGVSWAELSRRAREMIFETEKFEEICRECQWIGLCRRTSIN